MTNTHCAERSWTAPVLALLFLCGPWGTHARAQSDTVKLKDGNAETGKIQSEEINGLTIELRGGAARTIAWDTVSGIEYSGGEELAAAKETFAAARFEDALTEFNAIVSEKPRAPLMQQALLHLALIHDRLGNADEAVAVWRRLLTEFPKGRYLRRASEGLVWDLLAGPQADSAHTELDKLASEAGGLEGFAGEVDLLRGRVFEAQGKPAEGKKSFQAAEAAPGSSATVKQEASLGQARCMALEGKAVDAEKVLRGLALQDAPPHVLAGAWNGLATIWSEEGKAKRDIDRLYEALYGYLRGVVQYAPQPGEPTAEYERALAGAAKCFRFISQLEQTPDRKRRYEEQANDHMAKLRKEFPNSLHLEGP